MAILVCLSTPGGVPLFCKHDSEPGLLSYPLIGSLNGIHSFCSNSDVHLHSSICNNEARIIWKVFNKSITLILVVFDGVSDDKHSCMLLDLIFAAMVLQHGLDDLISNDNVDSIKKMLKASADVVSSLLESSNLSLSTMAAEFTTGSHKNLLEMYLESFAMAAQSSRVCLLAHGRIAAATRKWRELSITEQLLVPQLISTLPHCASRDIAIFLPETSPQIANRLLTFNLSDGCDVCAICGPSPVLSDLESKVATFWKFSNVDVSVTNLLHLTSESLHTCIHCVLLINLEDQNCLQVLNSRSRKSPNSDLQSKSIEALTVFYKEVTETIWTSTGFTSADIDANSDDQLTDIYICTSTYKYYALKHNQHQLHVIFALDSPIHALKSVCQQTLRFLLS